MLLETEYIEDTIRRCVDIEPEEFKELLNKSLAERNWNVGAMGGGYDAGTWNWYMERFQCKGVKELLEAEGFEWTPVPKRTPDEIAEQWEALGSDGTTPRQAES